MVRTLLPSLLLTVVMWFAVKAVGYYRTDFVPIWQLLLQIATGVSVYVLGAWICRFEALNESVSTIKGVLKR